MKCDICGKKGTVIIDAFSEVKHDGDGRHPGWTTPCRETIGCFCEDCLKRVKKAARTEAERARWKIELDVKGEFTMEGARCKDDIYFDELEDLTRRSKPKASLWLENGEAVLTIKWANEEV